MLNIIIINGKLIQIFSVKDDSRIHPPLWRAVIGSTVSYKCISAGNTRWYYKYFDTMPISLADFLTVKSVTLENAAYYYCYGLYENKQKHFIASAQLKVYGKIFFMVKTSVIFPII